METCCCGRAIEAHGLDREMLRAIRCLVAGMPATVDVSWRGRTWRVPRWYLGLHGLVPLHLRREAKKYRWEEVAAGG